MMDKRQAGLVLAGALLALLIFILPAAGYTPRVGVETKSDGTATVLINNRPAIRFVASNGDLGPADRAQITIERLKALAGTASPAAISIKPSGQKTWIVWGDTNICLVTAKDAHASSSTVEGLANSWAAKLRTLLTMPLVEIKTKEITVPLNETRLVDVGGASSAPLSIRDSFPQVASTEVSPQARSLVVCGKTVGDSIVQVSCDGETDAFTVHVRKYAGKIGMKPPAEVTGEPAPADVIERMAIFAAQKSIQVEEGAVAQLGDVKLPQSTLAAGEKMIVNVPVKIEGTDYIPVSTSVPVEVVNYRMERRSVGKLFYSNNPESVKKYQTLFSAPIVKNEPTRLLYHHQNVIGQRFRFNLELINTSDRPAKVHIIGAMAEPIIDTVLVGYMAGTRFLKDYLYNIGYVAEVPANSKYIVYSDDVYPMKTASGILEFRELNGVGLMVRVGADLPQLAYYKSGTVADLSNSDRNLHASNEVYPSPYKNLQAEYRVGEKWTFIPIGKNHIKGATDGKLLFGNYGVIYDIKVEISNPTAATKTVSVMFEPGAGLASGVFYIDGKIVATKYVTPPKEFTIATYTLAPNQTKMVSILTVPLSGSAYPANILVRS